jgi:hypothetical protein
MSEEPQAPARRRLSGPWAGTLSVLGVMGLLAVRMFLYDARLGTGEDQSGMLVLGGVFVLICTLGLAVGWVRHFKTRREVRNRRKPMSLS